VEGYASTREVAEYLAIQPGTLDAWAHRKKGPPFVKVEGIRRYKWADLLDWLEERKVTHT
jgi:DNA-binding transcriptional MerR regulator